MSSPSSISHDILEIIDICAQIGKKFTLIVSNRNEEERVTHWLEVVPRDNQYIALRPASLELEADDHEKVSGKIVVIGVIRELEATNMTPVEPCQETTILAWYYR